MESCQDSEEEKDKDELKLSDAVLVDEIFKNNEESCQIEEDSNFPDQKSPLSPGPSKSQNFQISKECIPCVPKEEQDQELMHLGVSVYDQTQFENEVMNQVDKALKQQEEAKRVADAEKELHIVNEDIRFVRQRLNHIEKALSMAPKDPNQMTHSAKRELSAIKREQDNKLKHLKKLEAKHKALQICISGSAEEVNTLQSNMEEQEEMDEETLFHLKKVFAAKETEEERLIRTGEMTPFGTVVKQKEKPKPRNINIPQNQLTDFDKFLLSEVESHESEKAKKASHQPKPSTSKAFSQEEDQSCRDPGFTTFTDLKAVSRKKKTTPKVKLGSEHAKGFSKKSHPNRSLVKNYKSDSDVSDFEREDDDEMKIHDDARNYSSDDVYIPDGPASEDEEYSYHKKAKKPTIKRKRKNAKQEKDISSDGSDSDNCKSPKGKMSKIIDDGNQEAYIKRIKAYEKEQILKKHQKILESEDGIADSDDDFTEFDEFKIPNSVWNKLYKYQQTCVRWLWELHQQGCGGIIGDEMGLGKTIQLIVFLVGLKVSKLLTDGDSIRGLGPVILVCPATVMHQWVREFHTWWPPFRAAVLHESGSFSGKKNNLIHNVNKSNGVLITSYNGIVHHQDTLFKYEWHYVVLDEGHKIRNPDAQATLAVKQFRTPHRIILSGSPVQNNLKELWSLFDFIFPGKLGTLPVFMQQFSVPIVLGGYANASQVQVQTAYKCATVLRDTIKPYLLRRMKSDVKMNINLPDKNEQVLFCQLTEDQVNLYKGYINSKEVGSILNARLQVFVGLINLRKICNHPDIFDGGPKIFKDTDVDQLSEEEKYGYYKRSGKMIVVKSLLRLWHSQKHRVLLFTQSRQMMDILEIFVKKEGYSYMKMDGSTSISSRQPAINKFNSDQNIFVFLLTTRVGGLGVNLTGANRVILYDPDWNPSTDAQARERAWRIGQNKQVTIYRLLTAGTIEEKIYHRQIFKQFVTNRVLKDPRQRRFFKSNDLYELFTYSEVGAQGTETSAIFAGTGSEIDLKKKATPRDLAIPLKDISFSDEKREQMKLLAKKLSMQLLKQTASEEKKLGEEKSAATEIPKSSEKTKSSGKILDSQHKEKAKKSRKRKAARIEGKKIDFVVKKSVFKPPETEEEKNLKQDDYVLSKLFKKSGVHAALKHDAIVEASAADYMIVEGEANRVAKEAIKALKESRRQCARAQEGIPTWTGQHGGKRSKFGPKKRPPQASNPSESSKSSPDSKSIFSGQCDEKPASGSSSDLISAIRKRKKVFGVSENGEHSSEDDIDSVKLGTEEDELLVDIRNYIAFQASVDGRASTKELVDTFRHKLPSDKTAVFKAMLSKICDFSRSSSGDGFWYLKEDFR